MTNDKPDDRPKQSELGSDMIEPGDAKTKLNGSKAPAKGKGIKLQLVVGAPEKWPHAVDGAALLDEITEEITRYLSLPPLAAELMALWSVGTHAASAAPIFPRLLFTSIYANCGKSVALQVLKHLCLKAIKADDITQAAIFRIIDDKHPTLLLDEADTWLNEHYRAVLNSGHAREGTTIRCEEVNGKLVTREFNTFAPIAIARIGSFGKAFGPLLTRSLSIRMSRRLPTDKKVTIYTSEAASRLHVLARKVQRWLHVDSGDYDPNPQIPPSLQNRDEDNWRFLFSLANVAGGRWPELIITMAKTFGQPDSDASNVDKRGILSAIKSVLRGWSLPHIPTVELCSRLSKVEGFKDARNSRDLSAKQAGHAMKNALRDFTELPPPKKARTPGNNLRGYETAPFLDMFIRYGIKTSEEEDDEEPAEDCSVLSSDVGSVSDWG